MPPLKPTPRRAEKGGNAPSLPPGETSTMSTALTVSRDILAPAAMREQPSPPSRPAAPVATPPALALRSVAVVVPTYREADNLPELIRRLGDVRDEHELDLRLLIMDDDSRDGTEEVVRDLDLDWVELVVRTQNRGLSPAVVDGLRMAEREAVIVMDADLSHPPEAVPLLLAALERGHDFVIGSRYVPGGSTDADWGIFRWINSKIATLMARPFTRAKDPMAGFFGFRREALEHAAPLNPVGYKIGLELIVKCDFRHIAEVPIAFADRTRGESKLNFAEQLKYVQHLRRLFIYRHPNWSYLLQFLVVGGAGTVVNLITLTLLLLAGLLFTAAYAVAIATSVVFNFFLNRRFTFSYAREGSLLPQFGGFVAACAVGMVVNYAVAVAVLYEFQGVLPQVAALAGILAGMGVNFLTNRFLVFKKPVVIP